MGRNDGIRGVWREIGGNPRGPGVWMTALCVGALLSGALSPGSAVAQEAPDSADLRDQAEELQAAFEEFRISSTPAELRPLNWDFCGIIIGRFCVEHDQDYPRDPWPEPVEVEMARMDMLRDLGGIHEEIPGDDWVLGQMVIYLGEIGRWDAALSLLRNCQVARPGWCDALQGMVLHRLNRFEESEEAFEKALPQLEEKRREEWLDLRMVTDNAGDGVRGRWRGEAADTMAQWLWHLSDPLYMMEGNDRWTEHLARWTEDAIREDAASPWEQDWGFDLQELLIRFGPSVEWAREKRPQTSFSLQDHTNMRSREKAHMRQFVPPGELIADPTGIPWGQWDVLEVTSPHTSYAPAYSPIFRPLTWQVARFRRADSLLVVAAYAPGEGTAASSGAASTGDGRSDDPFADLRGGNAPPPSTDGNGRPTQRVRMDPFGGSTTTYVPSSRYSEIRKDPGLLVQPPPGPYAQPAFFLSPGPGRELIRVDGREGAAEGVYQVSAPNGQYIASFEIYDEFEGRAWRARQGVRQDDLTPGLASVSDVLLVKDVPTLPETLEDAVPDALPGHAIPQGGSVIAAWEVYGLRPGESMAVNVAVNEVGGDFFQRIGEILRLSEPEEPVVMTWEEGGPDGMRAFFRSVRLSLPNLEPGRYLLSIEVVLPGRDAMVTSTPLVVGM